MRKSPPWLLFFAFALGAACSAAVAQDTQAKIEQYMQATVKVDHFMGRSWWRSTARSSLARATGWPT